MIFYFTFGFLSPHNGSYLQVTAPSWSEATNKVRQRYGDFQYQYTKEEFLNNVQPKHHFYCLEEF